MGMLTGGNISENTRDPKHKMQKKKRRKKAQTRDLETDQRTFDNDAEKIYTDVNKKSKRKRKSRIIDNLQEHNKDAGVSNAHKPTAHRIPHFPSPLPHPLHHHPLSKVFVERNRHFTAAEGRDLSCEMLQDLMVEGLVWNTRDVSVRVHSVSRIVGTFGQGFLAGFAVWNIIIVYVLVGDQLKTLSNLLQHYNSLVYPAQSLLYFLLANSTVSAFDRVNLAEFSVVLRRFFTLEPVVLASVFYFLALVLSLSQQMTSDRINLHHNQNVTLWPPGSEQQCLQPWIVVNLVVALLVGLAWVLISTRPDMDYTEEFLMSMELDEFPQHEEKCV